MLCQLCHSLLFRNRRPSRHSANDHGLADPRQGILCLSCCRCSAKAGNTRCQIIGNALFLQGIHLLPDGSVEGRISCMQPHGHFSFFLCLINQGQHLLQRQLRTVVDPAVLSAIAQQKRVDQTSGIDHQICLFQKCLSSQGDQIHRSRSGSYEMNHAYFSFSLTITVVKYPGSFSSSRISRQIS